MSQRFRRVRSPFLELDVGRIDSAALHGPVQQFVPAAVVRIDADAGGDHHARLVPVRVVPVGERRHGYGGAGVFGLAPFFDLGTEEVDEQTAAVVEVVRIEHGSLPLFGGRRDEGIGRRVEQSAAGADVVVIEVALVVGRIVPSRREVGRVEDGVVEFGHRFVVWRIYWSGGNLRNVWSGRLAYSPTFEDR